MHNRAIYPPKIVLQRESTMEVTLFTDAVEILVRQMLYVAVLGPIAVAAILHLLAKVL